MTDISNKSNLSEELEALDKEMTPGRDLWPGIEQAIAKLPQQRTREDVSNFQVWTRMAAAFVPVALVAGLWFGQDGTSPQEPEWLTPVSASYELQKKQLLQQVSGQHVVDGKWQDSMAELEAAEASLKQALQAQPQNPALMKMLNQVYQQQLSLIEKAHKPKFRMI